MPTHTSDARGADALPSPDSEIQSLHQQLQSALTEIGNLRQRALAESQSQASLSGLEAESGSAGIAQVDEQLQVLCVFC